MQSTGRSTGEELDRIGRPESPDVDPADAVDQAREVYADDADPEAPAYAPGRLPGMDLSVASEADLAEQFHEVPYDDDGDR